MSETPCQVCNVVIADGATFCARCAHQLDENLADITAYRGLAWDLDVSAAKQTHVHPSLEELAEEKRSPGVLPATPLPYNPRASRASEHLRGVLGSWARLIIEETGAQPPADTLTGIAAWLRPRVGWLRHHPAGGEAFDEITATVREARRVVDRPAERLYAGPCDCGEDLYARLDASYVVCHGADHEEPVAWEVDARRRWLLASAEDVLATATEISRALTRLAQPVTQSMIRGYVARGRLASRGCRVEGGRDVALFRVGDVLAIVAPEPEKVSA